MRRFAVTFLAAAAFVAMASATADARSILYFQGRSWGSWETNEITAVGTTGYINRTFAFNGNARINDSGVDSFVRSQLNTYCTNYYDPCIVVAYSAGGLRVLKAIDDIYASGGSLPGLLWVEGFATAAGGTKLAEVSTSGFTGFLAKLLGQQEAVDKDLTISAARSTYYYVQDAMVPTPAYMYHTAGNQNICKKILFVKICGNKYVVPWGGVGDGVVGLDSSSGSSSANTSSWVVSDGCYVGKYPDRIWEPASPCGGEARDHYGIVGRGVKVTEVDIGSTAATNDKSQKWDDAATNPDCAAAQCDNAFENTGADFSLAVNTSGAYVSTGVSDVSAQASATVGNTNNGGSCVGHCGVYSSSRSCQCDAACTSFGDCCGDYYAASCPAVNQ